MAAQQPSGADTEQYVRFDLLDSSSLDARKEIRDVIVDTLKHSTNKDKEKYQWLLNGLVDYYMTTNSEQTLDILTNIGDAHAVHLFEKLNDCMKAIQTRLPTLTLLGHIIIKQPAWLPVIIKQPILGAVIKCLKTDTDVPILMSALLAIVSLLPMEPVRIHPYLPSIFDAFSRLASFNNKKPGNVPDIYLLHLNVGVYALFHRLYGMYPVNFVEYLRIFYTRSENQEVFKSTVQPMLEKVRIHPLLILGNKDYELSLERWKTMETHDIIIDCAKMSLDPIEGTKEDVSCPIWGPLCGQDTISPLDHNIYREGSISRMSISSQAELPSQQVPSFVVLHPAHQTPPSQLQGLLSIPPPSAGSAETLLWSPAMTCGLSTPPPSSKDVTPSHSHSDMMGSYQGTPTTPAATPVDTPRGTTPPSEERGSEFKRSHSRTTQHPLSGDSKTNKLGLKLFHPKTPTPTQDKPLSDSSIPASPMKRDFTTKPPVTAKRTLAFREDAPLERAEDTLECFNSETASTAQALAANKTAISASASAGVPIKKELVSQLRTTTASSSGLIASSPPSKPYIPTSCPEVTQTPSETETIRVVSKLTETQPIQSGFSVHHDKASDINGEKTNIPPAHQREGSLPRAESSEVKLTLNLSSVSDGVKETAEEELMKKSCDSMSNLSVKSLPHVIEKLSDHGSAVEMHDAEDQEICDINKIEFDLESESKEEMSDAEAQNGDSPNGSEELTAQSVAQFMKTVNRIRFNSMSIDREKLKESMSIQRGSRSLSCPEMADEERTGQFDEAAIPGKKTSAMMMVDEQTETELGDIYAGGAQQPVLVVTQTKPISSGLVTLTTTSVPMDARKGSLSSSGSINLPGMDIGIPVTSAQSVPGSLPNVAMTTTGMLGSLSQDTLANYYLLQHAASRTSLSTTDGDAAVPYQHLWPTALPYTPLVPCQSCMERVYLTADSTLVQPTAHSRTTPSLPGTELPMYASFSPAEILDRHLQLGGLPPPDEINILKGRTLLLHNQLMYERHKREMHARRNRRLLGKVVKMAKIEEQNVARGDQLKLQEDEIQHLTRTLNSKGQENRNLMEALDNLKKGGEQKLKSLTQDNETLKYNNKELQNMLVVNRQENDNLQEEISSLKAQIFQLETQLGLTQEKADMTQELQEQVNHLNKEILLMGELQQQYKERQEAMILQKEVRPQTLYLIDTYKAENNNIRLSLDQKTVEVEGYRSHLAEVEELLKSKEMAMAEEKKTLERVKNRHKDQIKAMEERYQVMKKINRRQESHILELSDKIDRLKVQDKAQHDAGNSSNNSRTASPATSSLRYDSPYGNTPPESATHSPHSPQSLGKHEGSAFSPYQAGIYPSTLPMAAASSFGPRHSPLITPTIVQSKPALGSHVCHVTSSQHAVGSAQVGVNNQYMHRTGHVVGGAVGNNNMKTVSKVQQVDHEVQTDLTGDDLEGVCGQLAPLGHPSLVTSTSLLHQRMLDSASVDGSRQSSKHSAMLDSGFASEKLNF
ncbi:hamartin isoform X3 [Lingula anatina]|uniref:Hamartin isoform X3 n=1 Tax=Lingula anatina TaxID=7574 RepID=A0A1S3K0G1_LINAN|nr:hamartin isoform X3 [Lingula anatina]|eukprot:XP_013415766.1 hamartin isoform X3 [Lingula anatina]